MGLTDLKFKETDFTNKKIADLSDTPSSDGMTAEQLKAYFDYIPKAMIALGAINQIIDALSGTSGAQDIGASVTGVTGINVQAVMNSLKELIDDRYTKAAANALLDEKASTETVSGMIASVDFEAGTGVFTFTEQGGTVHTFDTGLEKVVTNWDYDEETQKLVLTLESGETKSIDLSAFVTTNEFLPSDTIAFEVNGAKVSAKIKNGSVTDEMLTSSLLSAVQAYAESCASSAQIAESAKTNAGQYADAAAGAAGAAETAKNAAEAAKTAAELAKTAANNHAILSQSYAKGGTGTREGEDADNAKYYKEESSVSKIAAESAKKAAEAANTSAQGAKTAAQVAAQSAETAKQSAQSSAASAASNAQRAEDAVAHNPTVQNGIWYVWNPGSGSYVSTGVPATGEMTVEVTYQQGDSPAVPPTGAWLTSPPEVAQGKFLWTKILFSDNTTGYSVARQGVDGTGAVVSVNGKSGEVTLTTDDINEGTRKYMSAAEKTKLGNVPNDTNAALNGKVDKVTGKQLSTNDYTNADKGKVNDLPENTAAALNGKISKVTPAAAGNLPTLTADGQLADSGKKLDDLGGDGAFIAVYNSTTYEEIKEAYESSTPVICFYNANLTAGGKVEYRLHALTDETAIFVGMESAYSDLTVDFLLCSSSSEWTVDYAYLLPAAQTTHNGYILAVNEAGNWQITDPPFAAKPTVITGTLSAGSTTFTLQNAAITINSVYDIYTDKWGVNPTDVVVTAGKITMTFEKQNASLGVRVEVR